MQDSNNIIERLFSSFSELEKAIQGARTTLEKREDVPEELVAQLRSYDDILGKQRALANKLCDHISKNEWDEVTRHVSLINGLSALIRDDARAILSRLSANPEETNADDDLTFC